MRNYIIADNQELTAYALQSLLKRDEGSAIVMKEVPSFVQWIGLG